MILLFVTATAASYLLAGAICLKASSDPKASSDGESQGSSWISLASGVILLLITIDIVAWSWWDEMAVYGWLDFGLILASPELSILVLGVLTGALVAYWHTKILANYSFATNTKLHKIWFWVIGSLVALGIALPLLSLIFQEMGLRSLQTPLFSVETSQGIGVAPLQFEIGRENMEKTFWNHPAYLSDTLEKDIKYLEKENANEIDFFKNAKRLSDNYLNPIANCMVFALRGRQLDFAQILPHIRPVAHALRRLLIEDSNNGALEKDVQLVKKRAVNGRQGLLKLVGPPVKQDQCPQMTPNDPTVKAAGLSKVPHLYVFIASIYLIGDDPEAALSVLEEGDSESKPFRNDMNYNRTRGWILYVLQRPLSESIKFHERALDFAERVTETEGDQKFLKRYARAQRLLRPELAFLLAQAGLRKGEALAYARTYFEEVNGWRNGLPRSESSIAIGNIQDWQKSDIYNLMDEIDSYTFYGYVLMAFGATEAEPNLKALRTARQLFREGLEVYDTKKEDFNEYLGEDTNFIRVRLETYFKQADFLLRETTRAG